ncbi:MAG: TrlF family AAA-like ATPase [Promethearchaeota archaeon]
MIELNEIKELPNGLRFYKTDLHIHMPIKIKNESKNYAKEIKINDVVNKLNEKNYDLIALSHHNSYKTIEKVKDYKAQISDDSNIKIKILSSIELNLKEDIHLVLIFPDDFPLERIKEILIDFGLKTLTSSDNYDNEDLIHFFEDTRSIPKKDIYYILKKCKDQGILVIAPHANKDKGFFKETKTPLWNELINKDLLLIFDYEKPPEYLLSSRKDLEKRIAQIQCSDAHTLDELGSKTTWIKMDRPRYKSLQQIIYEPKLRISLEEPQSKIKNKIIGISIDGGMLKDLKIHLNENYNAIIGGTGTGKSSLIDIFKYIFNCFGYNFKFKRETLNRLKSIHQIGTKFKLYYQSSDEIYLLERDVLHLKDGISDLKEKEIEELINSLPKLKIFKLISGDFRPIENNVNFLSPIIYGQNELLDYSFNSEDLIELFNSRMEKNYYEEFLKLQKKLEEKSIIFDELKDKEEKLREVEDKISEKEDLIKNARKDMNEVIKKFPKLEIYNQERNNCETIINILKSQFNTIKEFLLNLQLNFEINPLEKAENRKLIKEFYEKVIKIQEFYKKILSDIKKLKELINKINEYYKDNLKTIYDDYDKKYKDYCKESGKQNLYELKKYIEELEKEKNNLQDRKKELLENIEKLKSEKTSFLEEIEKLINLNRTLFEYWEREATNFTTKMKGKTKIKINKRIDSNKYENLLKQIGLTHSYQRKKILENFTPYEFIKLYETNRDELREKLKELKFQPETIDNIINNLIESLRIRFKICLEKPNVEFYLKKEDDYQIIKNLSIGERCATLLNFIFCQGEEPIIIDQPEDNIDYQYLDSIINILREQKYNRQFIIVSHNQNLPVLADADLILCMNNILNQKIEVKYSGSLEDKNIYNSILQLEGGKDAFERRKNKYILIEQ